jgi:hypothetical protein
VISHDTGHYGYKCLRNLLLWNDGTMIKDGKLTGIIWVVSPKLYDFNGAMAK